MPSLELGSIRVDVDSQSMVMGPCFPLGIHEEIPTLLSVSLVRIVPGENNSSSGSNGIICIERSSYPFGKDDRLLIN